MNGIVRILNSMQGRPLTLVDMAMTAGLILLFYYLARLASRQFQKWIRKRPRINATNQHLMTSGLNLTILFAGGYTSLAYLEVDLTMFLVPLGALSIGLVLGLQTLASNYIAGMVLLTERTIPDGVVIEVDAIRGTVLGIGLRATVVQTFSNAAVIIPNFLLTSQRLDNWTQSDQILRIGATVGVAYRSDIRQVHVVRYQRVVSHPAVL